MSLKKKKVKKGKRNKIVDVLKNSLSKADETNKVLLKQLERMDKQKSELESANAWGLEELNKTRLAKHKIEREFQSLKSRMIIKGKTEDGEAVFVLADELKKEIRGRSESTLIVDEYASEVKGEMPPFNLELTGADKVKKSYEPSELVEPGDYVEIDEDGKTVKRIDGNNLKIGKDFKIGIDLAGEKDKSIPTFILHDGKADAITKLNKELLVAVLATEGLKNKLKKVTRTVSKFGGVFEDGKEIKIEDLKSAIENQRVKHGDKKVVIDNVEDIKIDIGGSKKVSKENDPYDLLNKEYLKEMMKWIKL